MSDSHFKSWRSLGPTPMSAAARTCAWQWVMPERLAPAGLLHHADRVPVGPCHCAHRERWTRTAPQALSVFLVGAVVVAPGAVVPAAVPLSPLPFCRRGPIQRGRRRLRRRHGVVGVEDDPPRVPEKKCQPRFEEFEKFSDISAKSVSVLWRCLFFRLFNRLAGERAS